MHFKLILICLLVLTFGCKKKQKNPETTAPAILSHGILVLNEGLFQQNNSSLTWINTTDGSINNTFFEQKTNRGLGDTGNDIARYGNKLYIVVNVSSTVEILDALTGNPLHQISMIQNGVAKQPRSIAFSGSKAYVTCFDGFVDVIDTASYSILARIPVGANPEGLAVSNGKLYVANSGGLNAPNVDSTVSVINLSTQQEITRITVGKNPGEVLADSDGEIYVISRGDYGSVPPRLHRINTLTDTKTQSFSFDANGITAMGNRFILNYKTGGTTKIGLFDTQSESLVQADFISISDFTTLYSITYSPVTQKIYCSDANGYTTTGYLRVYSSTGSFLQSYHVGLNPSKIIIYE